MNYAMYENLLENALKLKPIDSAHLIVRLMASMEKSDPESETLWDQESLRRYKAYKQKCVKAKDLDEV